MTDATMPRFLVQVVHELSRPTYYVVAITLVVILALYICVLTFMMVTKNNTLSLQDGLDHAEQSKNKSHALVELQNKITMRKNNAHA